MKKIIETCKSLYSEFDDKRREIKAEKAKKIRELTDPDHAWDASPEEEVAAVVAVQAGKISKIIFNIYLRQKSGLFYIWNFLMKFFIFWLKNFFNKNFDFCTYPVSEDDDFDFNERVFGGEIKGIDKNIAFLFNADHDKHIFYIFL